LAVRAAIEEILPGIPVRLKWPNDVYLMDRKVCGILVESTPARQERVVNGGSDSLMSHVPSSHLAQEGGGEVVNGCSGLRSQSASAIERTTLQVIGIGVNVNNSLRRAPRDLQARATSLTDAAGRVFDRTELLIRILRRLTLILQELHEDQFPLSDRWQSACMLQGRTICLESGGQSAIGVCQGIDDEGALLLQTEAGITRHLTGIVSSIL
jgi:BirA family biotin operon repressor/biotin-[acetyl-CoA-carboxylase] ligase